MFLKHKKIIFWTLLSILLLIQCIAIYSGYRINVIESVLNDHIRNDSIHAEVTNIDEFFICEECDQLFPKHNQYTFMPRPSNTKMNGRLHVCEKCQDKLYDKEEKILNMKRCSHCNQYIH